MRAIIKKVGSIVARKLDWPALPLEPLPEQPGKKLWLTPEAFLQAINGPALAQWALQVASRLHPPRLPAGPGGRPRSYTDLSVLLMAVVQTAWRISYADIVDMCVVIVTWLTNWVSPSALPQGEWSASARDSTGNAGLPWASCRCCCSS